MKKKKTVLDVQFSPDKNACNHARSIDTAKLRWKARLLVLGPTIGCFY